MLTKRVQNLKPSPTLQMFAQAKALQAQGKDVISMAVGEPDWNTYEYIKKAAIVAIEQNYTKYTEASGSVELRTAVAKQVSEELKINYELKHTIIGTGAKYILYLGMQCLLEEDCEAIIPAPYWVSYVQVVELTGAKAKIVLCTEENQFKITAKQLENSINSKTKVLVLCSPSNPTGIIYSADEIKALGQVLLKNPHVYVISDDIYNKLIFDGTEMAPHLLQYYPELKERVLVVNGTSKTYSMTGWRIGWGVGPEKLIKAMIDLQSQSTSNTSSISQKAALAAVTGGTHELKKTIQILKHRRDSALDIINTIPGVSIQIPQGAFYLWLNIKSLLGKKYEDIEIKTSSDFSKILLDKYYVAAMTSIEFGVDGYIRLSYAVSEERLIEAINRIKKFVTQIK